MYKYVFMFCGVRLEILSERDLTLYLGVTGQLLQAYTIVPLKWIIFNLYFVS